MIANLGKALTAMSVREVRAKLIVIVKQRSLSGTLSGGLAFGDAPDGFAAHGATKEWKIDGNEKPPER